MSPDLLPPHFAELEPLVVRWARPTERERFAGRISSSLDELDAMYQTLLPRMEAILVHFADKPSDPAVLPANDRNLAFLAMAAMENARAVEVWRKVDVHSVNFPPSRIRFFQ